MASHDRAGMGWTLHPHEADIGAASARVADAHTPTSFGALVSCGGRPDLAAGWSLPAVGCKAATP